MKHKIQNFMKQTTNILISVFWPLSAPLESSRDDNYAHVWWIVVSILCIIPATAIFHHILFYRTT
jgi:hypothetical protein